MGNLYTNNNNNKNPLRTIVLSCFTFFKLKNKHVVVHIHQMLGNDFKYGWCYNLSNLHGLGLKALNPRYSLLKDP